MDLSEMDAQELLEEVQDVLYDYTERVKQYFSTLTEYGIAGWAALFIGFLLLLTGVILFFV